MRKKQGEVAKKFLKVHDADVDKLVFADSMVSEDDPNNFQGAIRQSLDNITRKSLGEGVHFQHLSEDPEVEEIELAGIGQIKTVVIPVDEASKHKN